MLKTSWRMVARAAAAHGFYAAKTLGHGKTRRSRITGTHRFLKRTEREALCRKLEGV